jgi:hypothetical protein
MTFPPLALDGLRSPRSSAEPARRWSPQIRSPLRAQEYIQLTYLTERHSTFAMNGTKSATKRTDARLAELTQYTARYNVVR